MRIVPQISIILPVYNGEEYLNEAIDSILLQTFTDFELIIVDDCSNDNSVEIIKSYNDSRIIFLQNEVNRRKSYGLNKGINISKGKYISIMDQDDIALPQKLEKQINFLEKHLKVGICGTQIQSFGKNINPNNSNYPLFHEEIQLMQLYTAPFAHPSVMIRKSELEKLKMCYPEYILAEDYHLWARLLLITKGVNLPEVLLMYRIHSNSLTKTFYKRLQNEQRIIRIDYCKKLFKMDTSFGSWILNSGNLWLRKLAIQYLIKENKSTFDKVLLQRYLENFNQFFKVRNKWKYYYNRLINLLVR